MRGLTFPFRAPALALVWGLLSFVAAACSFRDSVTHCSSATLCPTGQACYRGFCLTARDAGSIQEPVVSADAQTDAALAESQSPDSSLPAACEPAAESCNGKDDDCDGNTDEDSAQDCYPENTPGCEMGTGTCKGACSYGRQACVNGALEACSGAQTPQDERCTDGAGMAVDESCDGRVDEGCACVGGDKRSCYAGPPKTAGVGRCKAGAQVCANGKFGSCDDSVVPRQESCANEGSDDDCNGVKDDVRDRNGTCNVAGAEGACASGTWQCVTGSSQLQCVAAKPAAEQCNGKDDDCNGKVDDGFDLQSDRLHCGRCDKVCAVGELCCAGNCSAPNDAGTCNAPGTCPKCAIGEQCCHGKCINTQSDVNHCGGCDIACKAGTRPACCAGVCSDLMADQTCGRCDNACGLLSLGGLACQCGSLNGELQCVGLAVGGLLQLCL